MANTKSAKKRIKVTFKKALRNRAMKSRTKTAMKKVVAACGAGDVATARQALTGAVKTIDKAASRGVYHKNNAARKKSKLARMVNRISA
ncbi:MAG: 30S ribosomal protein S20 [Clostridiales bacterium]|nr:30S ribosomal protein S20 [Clostridiales bacterium]